LNYLKKCNFPNTEKHVVYYKIEKLKLYENS
jgi:hypothetical protein